MQSGKFEEKFTSFVKIKKKTKGLGLVFDFSNKFYKFKPKKMRINFINLLFFGFWECINSTNIANFWKKENSSIFF